MALAKAARALAPMGGAPGGCQNTATVVALALVLVLVLGLELVLVLGLVLVLVLGAATARPTSAVTMLAITRRRTERHCIIGA